MVVKTNVDCRHGGLEEATARLCGRREAAGQRLRIIQALEYKCRLCFGRLLLFEYRWWMFFDCVTNPAGLVVKKYCCFFCGDNENFFFDFLIIRINRS